MTAKKKSTKTDWARIDAMTDDDIDYSDIPETDEKFWEEGEWFIKGKKAISLRVDFDVVLFFKAKAKGKGYQTAMNKVLREYMEAHTKKRG